MSHVRPLPLVIMMSGAVLSLVISTMSGSEFSSPKLVTSKQQGGETGAFPRITSAQELAEPAPRAGGDDDTAATHEATTMVGNATLEEPASDGLVIAQPQAVAPGSDGTTVIELPTGPATSSPQSAVQSATVARRSRRSRSGPTTTAASPAGTPTPAAASLAATSTFAVGGDGATAIATNTTIASTATNTATATAIDAATATPVTSTLAATSTNVVASPSPPPPTRGLATSTAMATSEPPTSTPTPPPATATATATSTPAASAAALTATAQAALPANETVVAINTSTPTPSSTLTPTPTKTPTSTPTPTKTSMPTPTRTPPPAPTNTPTPATVLSPTFTSTPTASQGVIIRPGDNVQVIVDAQPAGTTFRLAAGTYLNQTITPKSGDVFIGGRAAILDGANTTLYAFDTNGEDGVKIDGLIIQNYNSPLLFGAIHISGPNPTCTGCVAGTNWVISNNEIRNNAAYGIRAGDGDQLLNNYVHDNGQSGIGGQGVNILAQDNEVAFNNTRNIDQYWDAGGSKFWHTTGLVLRHNYVHDNKGPGLWTDSDNVNALFEDNTITNNEGPGIFHEISYVAVIRNNTLSGNGTVEGSIGWLWGSQIMVSTSQDVEVYGNTVVAPPNANGIGVVQQNRGADSYGIHVGNPVHVHNNDITMQTGGSGNHGRTGAARDYDPNGTFFAGVTFDYNTYHVANPGDTYWEWGGYHTWAQFQAAGQEAHGTVQ